MGLIVPVLLLAVFALAACSGVNRNYTLPIHEEPDQQQRSSEQEFHDRKGIQSIGDEWYRQPPENSGNGEQKGNGQKVRPPSRLRYPSPPGCGC